MNTNNPWTVSKEFFSLPSASLATVLSYTACVVNGVKYVCKNRDVNRKTQNSRVYVCGIGSEPFYSELEEVIVMQYLERCRAVLFCYKWFDTDPKKKRLKVIQNITSVYVNAKWYKNDHFVLCTHAQQVFYTDDLLNGPNWNVVHLSAHFHVWDLPYIEENN